MTEKSKKMGLIGNFLYRLRKKEQNHKKHYRQFHEENLLIVNGNIKNVNIKTIRTFRDKFENLIQPKAINVKNGYLIRKAHAFNSFGIFYKLDVVFCNKNFQVINLIPNFTSQKVSYYFPECYFIYCFAPGMINFLEIKQNDIVRIS